MSESATSGCSDATKMTDQENMVENRYLLIDVGANLTNKKYNRDLDAVIARAQEAGVRKIVVSGSSVQGSRDAIRLSRLYPSVLYACVGVHPHAAKTWDDSTYSELIQLVRDSAECVAIGECGLDFKRDFSQPEEQLHVFESHIRLAVECNKPLLVHERDAHDQCINLLRKYRSKLSAIVIRCFTGNATQLRNYLELDCYIGVSGYIWRDNSDAGLKSCIQKQLLPINRLLLESDCPFMCPAIRGKKIADNIQKSLSSQSMALVERYCGYQRNEPCSLAVTAELIAHLYQIEAEELSLKTTFNALKVFGLK